MCVDTAAECAVWAARGECQANPNYMVGTGAQGGRCRASCKVCMPSEYSGLIMTSGAVVCLPTLSMLSHYLFGLRGTSAYPIPERPLGHMMNGAHHSPARSLESVLAWACLKMPCHAVQPRRTVLCRRDVYQICAFWFSLLLESFTWSFKFHIVLAAECEDLVPECPGWALTGECQSNPDYLIGKGNQAGRCKASCKACTQGKYPVRW
jgi:hypothetical protein